MADAGIKGLAKLSSVCTNFFPNAYNGAHVPCGPTDWFNPGVSFMKIIVPIKHVPEAVEVRIKEAADTLNTDGVPRILSPFDLFAVEAAIQLKEDKGGEVIIMTMGPPQATDAILKALAMGGDRAIHLTDPAFEGADSWSTAIVLAEQIRKMEYDLIICGRQAMDWDLGQVGAELAELLDLPQITGVRHLEITEDGKHVITHRVTEDGYEVVKAEMPVLLTATKGLNEPRLPNIMGIMKAKKKPLETIDAAALGLDATQIGRNGALSKTVRVFPPEKRKGGIKLEDVEPKEAARQLVEFLAKKGAI